MIIIGHEVIEHEVFTRISSQQELEASSNLVWFDSQIENALELARMCFDNSVTYAVKITSFTDLVVYANLGAKYVIIQHTNVEEFQRIANDYLLDTKILVLIQSTQEIENIARLGIDGVIYQHIL